MKYSQGWLVGQDELKGYLVPFELCVRNHGTYRLTGSGPVNQNIIQSFSLCLWAVQRFLHDIGIILVPFDCHLHFPLHHMNGSGVSCRLSFAYSLLEALGVKLMLPASGTALTGDLNLNGDVLPVEGIPQKISVVREAGFQYLIVADKQPESSNFLTRVHHLKDLIGREI
ncbi:S16 family serine protease [Bacillus toyonensis]